MSTRKQFITAAASVPLIAAAPRTSPQSKATPAEPPVSEAARALASRMRAFDSALTEKELDDIAKGIDDNFKTGQHVNPHGTALKNWDEPVAFFEVSA